MSTEDSKEIPDIPNSHVYKQGGYEGWLLKFGSNRKWQRRYFVLKEDKLSYYTDITNVQKKKVRKEIDVKGASLITLKKVDYQNDFSFAILPINVSYAFVLACKDLEDRVKWMQALNQGGAVEHTSSGGISEGNVDQKSIKEDYCTLAGPKPSKFYFVLRPDKTLSYYQYKCDLKAAGVLDLNDAKVSVVKDKAEPSFEMSVVHPTPRTAILTCGHKNDPKEWIEHINKAISASS